MEIKNKLGLAKNENLLLMGDETALLSENSSVDQVFQQYRDDDGFLYINYYLITKDNLI